MSRSRTSSLLLALILAGVGCTTPGPTAPASSAPSIDEGERAGESTVGGPTGRPTPSPSAARRTAAPTPGLNAQVSEIDDTVTGPFLEVVSDGLFIWYSGVEPDDLAAETATVLYRLHPDSQQRDAVWRTADPAFSIARIAGHNGTVAFAEIDATPGHTAWNFWLLSADASEPILLDQYPEGASVPGFVPSFDVDEERVIWTAFDLGDDGPVSEMWLASAPDWEPRLVASRRAEDRELWLPSLWRDHVAFVELIYSEDRTSDDRHVLLMNIDDPAAEPRRLDTSGLATMPQLVEGGVFWKESVRGMSMFNWGGLRYYSFADERVRTIDLTGDEVNYPSVGDRFVTAQSIDSSLLMVYDRDRDEVYPVERHPPAGPGAADRPSLSGTLLVWVALEIDESHPRGGPPPKLRWTYLPPPGADVRGFP